LTKWRKPAPGCPRPADRAERLSLRHNSWKHSSAARTPSFARPRSLSNSDYHLQLATRYRALAGLCRSDEIFDDGSLLQLLTDLARTDMIYYLHPSFGFTERFYARRMVW
jgi:hypothetical protein